MSIMFIWLVNGTWLALHAETFGWRSSAVFVVLGCGLTCCCVRVWSCRSWKLTLLCNCWTMDLKTLFSCSSWPIRNMFSCNRIVGGVDVKMVTCSRRRRSFRDFWADWLFFFRLSKYAWLENKEILDLLWNKRQLMVLVVQCYAMC